VIVGNLLSSHHMFALSVFYLMVLLMLTQEPSTARVAWTILEASKAWRKVSREELAQKAVLFSLFHCSPFPVLCGNTNCFLLSC
jgi:hypothetical protein